MIAWQRTLLAWSFLAYSLSHNNLPSVERGPVVVGPFGDKIMCEQAMAQWRADSKQHRAIGCWSPVQTPWTPSH